MREHTGYATHLARQGLSTNTARSYLETISRLEQWSGTHIEDVTPDQAAAFLNRPHLSRSTRNAYHRWLARWCAWAGSDLLDMVRRASAPGPAPKPVRAERVDLMLGACRTDEETALILLGVLAGLRRSEIARFRGSHLDQWERTISVVGKGDRAGVVPAPRALISHARRMPAAGYWFPSPLRPGMPVAPCTVNARMRAIADRAGAGAVTTHQLRHTYATELVRAGTPLTTVQRCMRHANLGTTAAYVGVGGDDLAAAAASLPWSGYGAGSVPLQAAA